MSKDEGRVRRPFEPNTTQTPNEIFDELMARIPGDKLKVLLTIVRKTYGWHKYSDRIANSQYEKLTGLKKRAIQKFKSELIAEGIIGKIDGPKGGIDEYFFIAGSAPAYTWECMVMHGGDAPDCMGGMHSGAPTKLTIKTNNKTAAEASGSLYPLVCDIFSKGYEALEGSKLSWVGKGSVYGKAVKTLIKQAEDCLPEGHEEKAVLALIKERAAVLYRTMEAEKRTGKLFHVKHRFVPTTLVNLWNKMVPDGKTVSFADPEVAEIPAEELAKHKAVAGG